MRVYNEMRDLVESRLDLAIASIRIYLGVALFVRGILFLTDAGVIQELVKAGTGSWGMPTLIAHYISMAHLVGGLLLVLGLMARLAALAQMPVLFGAVFFVHFQDGLLATGQALELSSLVLFLLILIAVIGPGAFSLDGLLLRETRPTFGRQRLSHRSGAWQRT